MLAGTTCGRRAERTNEGDAARLLQRERRVAVLEQDGARSTDLTHDLVVVGLHVDVGVRRRVVREERIEAHFVRESVHVTGQNETKRTFRVVLVLVEEIPRRDDALRHIVHAGLRNRAVLYERGEVGAEPRMPVAELDVTRHRHL